MAISGVDNLDICTAAGSKQTASPKTTEDFIKLIAEKRDELLEKIKNGDTEESFQIGSRSFTEKEWDTLLEKFDRIQDEFKRQIREEAAKKEESEEKKQLEKTHDEKPLSPSQTAGLIDALVSNSSTCTYHSDNPDERIMYITCYTKDGIFCRKAGAIGDNQDVLWYIPFHSPEQYDKVLNFINGFDSSENLRFASNKNFWQDFLQEKIDVADFMNFLDFYQNN